MIQSHEEEVSTSLDDALMKTLQGATFTRKQPIVDAGNVSCSSLIQEESKLLHHPIVLVLKVCKFYTLDN